jgi:hypothetical protein
VSKKPPFDRVWPSYVKDQQRIPRVCTIITTGNCVVCAPDSIFPLLILASIFVPRKRRKKNAHTLTVGFAILPNSLSPRAAGSPVTSMVDAHACSLRARHATVLMNAQPRPLGADRSKNHRCGSWIIGIMTHDASHGPWRTRAFGRQANPAWDKWH